MVRENPEGGNLRLEVEEMENVERLKRSYYFRFQLSVFNFLFLLTAVVAHPFNTAEHRSVPFEPLVFFFTASSFCLEPPINLGVVNRGKTASTAFRVDKHRTFRTLVEHILQLGSLGHQIKCFFRSSRFHVWKHLAIVVEMLAVL